MVSEQWSVVSHPLSSFSQISGKLKLPFTNT
jgi:hypothetical protein